MRKSDFESLSDVKLEDARILYESESYSNAFYLAGYSVEFALKACIALQFSRHDIPDKRFVLATYTHDLRELIKQAGLSLELRNFQNRNATAAANWAIVTEWDEQSRYQTKTKGEAQYLISAIVDPNDGVLPWIKTFW
ncbi:HEPN domain-containing protein [Rhizobium sp. G21]|uniref:HEPN domain-containing protein n=1 Tax=Rhizobium sp. G21 TaxID=2758439 RepID=UPI0015FF5579|nr:HEPN domain-containing protein [Rhizobium sp. G21]MBB1250774.1 HEPN domain-containing protein [Rhizobium sp. G21]